MKKKPTPPKNTTIPKLPTVQKSSKEQAITPDKMKEMAHKRLTERAKLGQ